MFKLVEPNEERYAVLVNEYNFSLFDLFYTDAGYKTISGELIKNFESHCGYFIIHKEDKTISFINTIVFTEYQDKEYFLSDLIKKTSRKIDDVQEVEWQENKPDMDGIIPDCDFPRFELRVSLWWSKAVVEMRTDDGDYQYKEEVSDYWKLEPRVREDALNNVIERGKRAINREMAKIPGMMGDVNAFPKLVIEP